MLRLSICKPKNQKYSTSFDSEWSRIQKASMKSIQVKNPWPGNVVKSRLSRKSIDEAFIRGPGSDDDVLVVDGLETEIVVSKRRSQVSTCLYSSFFSTNPLRIWAGFYLLLFLYVLFLFLTFFSFSCRSWSKNDEDEKKVADAGGGVGGVNEERKRERDTGRSARGSWISRRDKTRCDLFLLSMMRKYFWTIYSTNLTTITIY